MIPSPFTPEYYRAMSAVDDEKCEHCGVSVGAHAMRTVAESCRGSGLLCVATPS